MRRALGLRTLSLFFVSIALIGCGQATTATPTSRLLDEGRAKPGQLVGILPSTDLSVGPNNRFLIGFLDDRNQPVTDAQVFLRFHKLSDQNTVDLRGEAMAVFRGFSDLPDRGLYVARTSFDEAGRWGVEALVARSDSTTQIVRLPFEVGPTSRTPAIGAQAPMSQTPTAAMPSEAELLCSARPVDHFHRLSVADAFSSGKPTLVLFATPGFCQTRICGPSLDVVQQAVIPYADRLNVVHVEIFKNGQPPEIVPTVAEWSLMTEPWVFLVDATGVVVDKFEGGITQDELKPALGAWLGA